MSLLRDCVFSSSLVVGPAVPPAVSRCGLCARCCCPLRLLLPPEAVLGCGFSLPVCGSGGGPLID